MSHILLTDEDIKKYEDKAVAERIRQDSAKILGLPTCYVPTKIHHEMNNLDCPGCKDDLFLEGYPKKCPQCGKLIHAELDYGNEFLDKDYAEVYPLLVKCESGCDLNIDEVVRL